MTGGTRGAIARRRQHARPIAAHVELAGAEVPQPRRPLADGRVEDEHVALERRERLTRDELARPRAGRIDVNLQGVRSRV